MSVTFTAIVSCEESGCGRSWRVSPFGAEARFSGRSGDGMVYKPMFEFDESRVGDQDFCAEHIWQAKERKRLKDAEEGTGR